MELTIMHTCKVHAESCDKLATSLTTGFRVTCVSDVLRYPHRAATTHTAVNFVLNKFRFQEHLCNVMLFDKASVICCTHSPSLQRCKQFYFSTCFWHNNVVSCLMVQDARQRERYHWSYSAQAISEGEQGRLGGLHDSVVNSASKKERRSGIISESLWYKGPRSTTTSLCYIVKGPSGNCMHVTSWKPFIFPIKKSVQSLNPKWNLK